MVNYKNSRTFRRIGGMRRVRIEDAHKFAEALNAKGVVILAFDYDGKYVGASYGDDRDGCDVMKTLLDKICDMIESGRLRAD